MGDPSVFWQQQMEKAITVTYNNTHSYQKPILLWGPDYTTTFTTRFRPIPLIDDYNPTYIDPNYDRDPYWDTEIRYTQLETPKKTIELKFEVGDIDFHEIFTVMENLTGSIIGLMFLQQNHTILDMRQGILIFPFFSTQLKTADHRYSNVLEPIRQKQLFHRMTES